MTPISHQIQLLRRPTGLPTPDDFALRIPTHGDRSITFMPITQ